MSADGFSGGPPAGAAADWTIPQGWDHYTAEEHRTWLTLYERQAAILPGRASDAFLHGLDALDLRGEGVPDFARINERLEALTGWSVVTVPGLVPDDVFFDHLANRRFPAGRFIRKPNELDYLQEPDVFHDVFGHVPMLTDPVFADYMAAYGRGRCAGAGARTAAQPGAPVLVHGGVRAGAVARVACASMAPASSPPARNRCSAWRTARPTASPSTWSG